MEDKPEVKKAGGVYYTPKYIVDYIVKNTVGTLVGAEGDSPKSPREIEKIKILDPACGSGSFLLGAYQLLLDHHLAYYIDERNIKKSLKENRIYQLREGEYRLTIAEKHRILLNNIYGVDIDSQAVEVTKLSLLLKLMEGESQESTGMLFKYSEIKLLPDLSANIKCGNSLIGSDFYETGQMSLFRDEETVRRINVFDWEKEFPDIFAHGGFDAVIGNPPWGSCFFDDELAYIKNKNQDIIVRIIDSFMFFLNLVFKLVRRNGLAGQILPDVILYQKDNLKLREKILMNTYITSVINFGNGVFEGVNRPSCVLTFRLDRKFNKKVKVCDKSQDKDKHTISFEIYSQSSYLDLPNCIFVTSGIKRYFLLSNFKEKGFKELASFIDEDDIQRGVSPDLKEAFIVTENIIEENLLERNKIKKTITGGRQLHRYFLKWDGQHIIYTTNKDKSYEIPNITGYISKYRSKITCKEVKMKKHQFFSLHRARDEKIFLKDEKILGVITADSIKTSIDREKFYPTDGIYLFSSNTYYSNKFLIGILNSKLFVFLYRLFSLEHGRVLAQVKPTIIRRLPFPILELSNNAEKVQHNRMVGMVEEMLGLQEKFHGAKMERDREMFRKQIEILDRQIDQLVYELYQLTDEEIKIVEESSGK